MKFIPFLSFILTLTLFSCSEEQEASRPNVLIFFSDELAPEYLGCYGGDYETPAIDQLAEQGMKFNNAYTVAPMCTPSRYALLTGQYAGRCNAPEFLDQYPQDQPYSVAWNTYLSSSDKTLPKILSGKDYFTGMVGKWHISDHDALEGLPEIAPDADLESEETNRLLQSHQEVTSNFIKQEGGFDYAGSVLFGNYEEFPVKALRFHNTEWMTKGACEFLEKASEKDQPFFLYAATTCVHGPSHHYSLDQDPVYTPEGKIEELAGYREARQNKNQELSGLSSGKQHKKAGMWFLNNHVKEVMEKLDELGLKENTIVFFMADHNTEPGKATTYQKGNVIPFIISAPELEKNIEKEAMVQTIDVFPTLLELAGLEKDNVPELDGKSLVDLMHSRQRVLHDYIYLEAGFTRAVTDGRYKYIAFRYPEAVTAKMKSGELEYAPEYTNRYKQGQSRIAMEKYPGYWDHDQFYDLKKDPHEQNNLYGNPQYSDEIERLRAALKQKLATFRHPFDLSDTTYMNTDAYKAKVEVTRSWGTDDIYWLETDHDGEIVWPPKNP